MLSKAVAVLVFVAACYALPVEDGKEPSYNQQSEPAVPIMPSVNQPVEAPTPESEMVLEIPVGTQGSKEPQPQNSDLKTDSSLWWSSYYKYSYPYYSRNYYRPRVYTYYAPNTYWSPYW